MDKLLSKKLKQLLEDEKFEALAAFYGEYLNKLREQNVIGEDNGQTLKLTYMREGGIQAIKDFFNNLEREIYD